MRTGTRIIKDPIKLSFDYVPQRLVHREEQMQRLQTLFRPVLESGVSQNVLLTGNVGTGKTAASKRFCMDLVRQGMESDRSMDYVMINCRQNNTEASVLLRLVSHFDPGYPDRGFSSAEMLRALRRHIEKRGIHLVVILDEVDVLIKRGVEDLVYQLTRFDEERVGGKASLSLILISQQYVMDMLDSASLSTFKRANTIRFGRYATDQLADILGDRVELALYPNHVGEGAVELIADIASEWGDARFAIELLERATMIAEEQSMEMVLPEHVRAAKAMTYSVVTESRLEELDRQRQLVLLGIAQSMGDRAYITTGMAERGYQLASEEFDERPRKHTQYWSYLRDLSNEGLVETKVTGDASGGRTTYISLPDIPAKELSRKLRELLERVVGR